MALKKHVVIHPVRHEGRFHARGKFIDLNEDDAKRLLDKRVVRVADATAVQPVALGESTLGKLTLEELVSYAQLHSIDVQAGTTKGAILEAITKAQAAPSAPEQSE